MANATGLACRRRRARLSAVRGRRPGADAVPASPGGVLEHAGQVEVVSSLERDGRPVFRDLRWGIYVVFEAPTDYVARCFAEYGVMTDPSGRYAALYRPYHLIGLELGISVVSAALRGEPTGGRTGSAATVVATAKRDLAAGRDARRRGRLHGVGQAAAGRAVARGRRTADRPRAQGEPEARHRRRRGPCAGATSRPMPATRPSRRGERWRRSSVGPDEKRVKARSVSGEAIHDLHGAGFGDLSQLRCGKRRSGALDSPCWFGHPARGPGLSDFDRVHHLTDLFSRSGFRVPVSTSTVSDKRKRHSRSLPLVEASHSTEEEARLERWRYPPK